MYLKEIRVVEETDLTKAGVAVPLRDLPARDTTGKTKSQILKFRFPVIDLYITA